VSNKRRTRPTRPGSPRKDPGLYTARHPPETYLVRYAHSARSRSPVFAASLYGHSSATTGIHFAYDILTICRIHSFHDRLTSSPDAHGP
jgi:hypothetical protein